MVENGDENIEKKEDEVTALEILLPSNCLPLAHQVAGHFYGKGKTKLGDFVVAHFICFFSIGFETYFLKFKGLLQTNDGYVLKPVQSPPRGEREHNFFKRIFSSNDSDLNQDELQLRNLLPTYRGSLIHNESNLIH